MQAWMRWCNALAMLMGESTSSAAIARNDLIAHLDGASGCGGNVAGAHPGSARSVDEGYDCCEDISVAVIAYNAMLLCA